MDVACRFFMKQEQRTVHPDFSDIRLENRFYRVDPRLRSEKVIVRWDPFLDTGKIFIYSLHNEYLGIGTLYHRERGEPIELVQPVVPRDSYLEMLIRQHENHLRDQAEGIDYRRLSAEGRWSYNAFVQGMARLIGRKGGTSAFTTDEHEQLHKIYQRYPNLNEPMLMRAAENAEYKTIIHIAYQLQRLSAIQGES